MALQVELPAALWAGFCWFDTSPFRQGWKKGYQRRDLSGIMEMQAGVMEHGGFIPRRTCSIQGSATT